MTNQYFNNPDNIVAGQRATASSVSGDLDLIQAGFDLLPTPGDIKNGTINFGTDTGTTNAFLVNETYIPTSLTDGFLVVFRAAGANTGAATLTVNGFTRALVRPDGNPLTGYEIQQNQIIEARFNAAWNAFTLVCLTAYPGTAYVTLPPQAGKAGLALTTDGANSAWGFVADPLLQLGLV